MTTESTIALFIPSLALFISIWSLFLGSKYRSLESAQKYIDVLEKSSTFQGKDGFDCQLKDEIEQAAHYYLWKSLLRLSPLRRSKFNYIGFLVFTSIGLGFSIYSLAQNYSNEGLLSALPLAGGFMALLAMGFMAYVRYESYMLESFLDLRKYGLYTDSCSYSFLSKEKIVDESIIPVLASSTLSIIILACFETRVALGIFLAVVAFITVGNIVGRIRNDRSARKEAENLISKIKQHKKSNDS